MNRATRRAEAAKARAKARADTVKTALAVLGKAAAEDPSVSGATLVLASGETIYLPAKSAAATRQGGEGLH